MENTARSDKKIPFTRTILLTVAILMCTLLLLPKEKETDHTEQPSFDFCTRLPLVRISGRDPALVANTSRLWKQARPLNVYFRGYNDPKVLERIVALANIWARHCDMSFRLWPTVSGSDIRVAFNYGGYASVVGIEAEEPKYKYNVTMCLQNLDKLTDSAKFRRTVLHEFGHALGLEHELHNPSAKIPWDTAALYDYYLTKHGWQPDSVNKHVLSRLVDVENSDFDSTSIMIYAVPNSLTHGKFSASWPADLSSTDKKYIKEWYQNKHKIP